MIFFVYWKQSYKARWTIYGTYEDGAEAHLVRAKLLRQGIQARLLP